MAQGSAINDIMQMRQQGLSNNQIIQNLQRAGYNNTQIFDSMNQADTKMAVEGVHPSFMQPPQMAQQELFTQPPQEAAPQQVFSEPQTFTEQPAFTPQSNFAQQSTFTNTPRQYAEEVGGVSQEKIEELVEAIIEEKWTEIARDINKIVDWKNKVEARISEMEIRLDSLKENFSDLNRAVISKVNEYDKHILEVGSDIRAMEKVFSKVLPTFTENVNELSRITSKVKSKEHGDSGK